MAQPPRSTYRLQLRGGMNFAGASRIVPYLARLGISRPDLRWDSLFPTSADKRVGHQLPLGYSKGGWATARRACRGGSRERGRTRCHTGSGGRAPVTEGDRAISRPSADAHRT